MFLSEVLKEHCFKTEMALLVSEEGNLYEGIQPFLSSWHFIPLRECGK